MGQLHDQLPEVQRQEGMYNPFAGAEVLEEEEGMGMNEYYASLVKYFNGLYIKLYAENDMIVRQWLNKEMRGLWCSVYTKERYEKICEKYNSQVIGPEIFLTEEDGVIYENY